MRSSQTVYHHLSWLEEAGYMQRLNDRPRTPKLIEKGWEAALSGDTPLLGRIAAGRGLEAVAVSDEAYSVAAELLLSCSGSRRYLLRVVGQSITEAKIEDGDLLVIEEDEALPNGTVVELLNGGEEVTVKRIYRNGQTVKFKPEKGEHEEITIAAEEVKVQGKGNMGLPSAQELKMQRGRKPRSPDL